MPETLKHMIRKCGLSNGSLTGVCISVTIKTNTVQLTYIPVNQVLSVGQLNPITDN